MRYGKITVEVGLLYFGAVRDFLKRCKFNGLNIEWYEGSGWLERTFIVKGNERDLLNIKHSLEKWAGS